MNGHFGDKSNKPLIVIAVCVAAMTIMQAFPFYDYARAKYDEAYPDALTRHRQLMNQAGF